MGMLLSLHMTLLQTFQLSFQGLYGVLRIFFKLSIYKIISGSDIDTMYGTKAARKKTVYFQQCLCYLQSAGSEGRIHRRPKSSWGWCLKFKFTSSSINRWVFCLYSSKAALTNTDHNCNSLYSGQISLIPAPHIYAWPSFPFATKSCC